MHKHPLVPAVHFSTNKVYRFSDEAKICNSCNLPDSKCSHNCKRYKEELAKLNNKVNEKSN